jgi:hypothetical protein
LILIDVHLVGMVAAGSSPSAPSARTSPAHVAADRTAAEAAAQAQMSTYLPDTLVYDEASPVWYGPAVAWDPRLHVIRLYHHRGLSRRPRRQFDVSIRSEVYVVSCCEVF